MKLFWGQSHLTWKVGSAWLIHQAMDGLKGKGTGGCGGGVHGLGHGKSPPARCGLRFKAHPTASSRDGEGICERQGLVKPQLREGPEPRAGGTDDAALTVGWRGKSASAIETGHIMEHSAAHIPPVGVVVALPARCPWAAAHAYSAGLPHEDIHIRCQP